MNEIKLNLKTKSRTGIAAFLLIVLTGLLMRILFLGNTFLSSDNVMLAERIVKKPGFIWMVLEQYGLYISLSVKLFASLCAFLGITVNEFWWKLPVALAGTLQIPLTYLFLRRIDSSVRTSVIGAGCVALLPIHIFQSRYLWGYEVFGVMFLTLALWKLLDFFDNPNKKTGIIASLFSGLYIISHGYFVPFAPLLLVLVFMYSPDADSGFFKRLWSGLEMYFRNYAWLFMVLFLPFTARPIIHMLNKKTNPGFYVFDHLPDFVSSAGIAFSVFIAAAILYSIFRKGRGPKEPVFLFVAGLLYMAPLIFGTPKGVTVVKGYMLVGIFCFMVASLRELDKLLSSDTKAVNVIVAAAFILTLWGGVESLFFRDRLVDPSLVVQGRGKIYDPGTKAAGYFFQKYVPSESSVLAMHQKIEEPNLYYYFRRKIFAYDDLTNMQTLQKLNELKDKVDVIICSKWQVPYIEKTGLFKKRVELTDKDEEFYIAIFAKGSIPLPELKDGFGKYNELFDREFAWNKEILAGFVSNENKSFGQLILESMKREKNKKLVKKYLYFLY